MIWKRNYWAGSLTEPTFPVYQFCSFIPLIGLLTALLPKLPSNSISTSFVNAKAKRRQYKRTASEADKVHG
jgi:hypothetical protein